MLRNDRKQSNAAVIFSAAPKPNRFYRAVEIAISQPANWKAPHEYLVENVAQTVSKIVLGYTSIKKTFS